MIYFDNSATTQYKPECVINATVNAMKFLSANPGRSGHSASIKAGLLVHRTRRKVADFIGCDPSRVVFTLNCSDALNMAILGSVRRGGHVVTSACEHNSVLRPLFELRREGVIDLTVLDPDESGHVSVADTARALRKNTYLVAVGSVSNVTGSVAPVHEIGRLCRSRGILYLCDAAQSGGYTDIDMHDSCIDMLALAPHKGLHAPMGVGVLALGENVRLNPIRFGGTGTMSESVYQPMDVPEGFETGTLPLPAIAGLCAGVSWTAENAHIHRPKLSYLTDYLLDGLKKIDRVTVYTPPVHGAIAAFNVRDYKSEHVADILSSEYDIAVRSGLHCAPKMNEHLGTTAQGIVRASLGCDNTLEQCDFLLRAVAEIAG